MQKALVLLVLLIVASGAGGADAPRETRTILIFPFENQSARPDLNWIGESFPEVLSTRLAAADRYVLEREDRDAAYEKLNVPRGAPLPLASNYKVAEILGVDWAVMGWYTAAGQGLTARAQLLDMRRARLAPALEVTGDLAELVELQSRLAWRLLATHDAGFTVGKEEDFNRNFPPVRLDAFENYIRGILEVDGDRQVKFLREADRLNPSDHRAAYELGRFYFNKKDYANSAPWLEKLAPPDRDFLEALFLLGVDDFFLGKEAEAERTFAALAGQIPLNEVTNNLGVMEARRGRYVEALPRFERAYENDSSDFDFCLNLGVCLWYLKRYDDAARHVEEAVRENDEDPAAHALLAAVLGKLQDFDGQRRELEWLAEHEAGGPAGSAEEILPQARVKKNYEGRGYQLLSLALRNAAAERLASQPPERRAAAVLVRPGASAENLP